MPESIRVPDSLDLAERARLGLSGLMGTCDPGLNYEPYLMTFYAARPAYFIHWSGALSGVQPKYMEALALLKCMTGSPDTAQEKGFIRAMMDNAAEDGFIYDRKDPKRPWNVGVGYGVASHDEDYANIAGNGRWANAMWYMYQLTGDEEYKAALKRCAEKLYGVAVLRDDYAFYPDSKCGNDFSWVKGGWPHTNEPKGPQEGGEGAMTFYQTQAIRGLVKWYYMSGDERMLDLSARLARFVMKPRFYGGIAEVDPAVGAEKAHWWGHVHGNLAAFRGLMEYARAAGDLRAMEFVRDGYEWLRQNMCVPLAQQKEWEGCSTADQPALAIMLTDAGMGDFWDDADRAARNATAQAQVTDLDGLRRVGEMFADRPRDARFGAPDDWRYLMCIGLDRNMPGLECVDNVMERSLGGFVNFLGGGRYQQPHQMACCTGNGLQGFYYAWEAAVRHSGGVSTVNLLFTRFSEWMDLVSFLPYEGRAVVHNKTSKTVNVRIPGGVLAGNVRLAINGNPVTPTFCGRYVSVTGLSGGEEIAVEFPLEERSLELSLPNINKRTYRGAPKVTARFRGATCIGLDGVEANHLGGTEPWVRQFDEPKYRGNETLYKDAPYYVPPKVIKWY